MTSGSSGEQVDLDPQIVANGAAQLDTAATTLEEAWRTHMSAITALNGAEPWGGDESGTTFRSAYAEGGALDLQGRADPTVTEVAALGGKVRTAASNSLGADDVQAREVRVEVDGL